MGLDLDAQGLRLFPQPLDDGTQADDEVAAVVQRAGHEQLGHAVEVLVEVAGMLTHVQADTEAVVELDGAGRFARLQLAPAPPRQAHVLHDLAQLEGEVRGAPVPRRRVLGQRPRLRLGNVIIGRAHQAKRRGRALENFDPAIGAVGELSHANSRLQPLYHDLNARLNCCRLPEWNRQSPPKPPP